MLKYVKTLAYVKTMTYICNVKLRQALFEMLKMKKLSRKQLSLLFDIIKDCKSKFLDNVNTRLVDISYDFRFGRAKVAVTYMANCTYHFEEGIETLNTLIQFDCLFEADKYPERYVVRPMEVISGSHNEANIFDFLANPLKAESLKYVERSNG